MSKEILRRWWEVASGIFRLETELEGRWLCVYVLLGSESALLFDAGVQTTPEIVIRPFFEALGIPVEKLRYAVTSHADVDHMGGNAEVRRLFPYVKLYCHGLDRELAENVEKIIRIRYEKFAATHGIADSASVQDWFREIATASAIDVQLRGDEVFNLGSSWAVHVRHTPGHSDGHLSLFDPRSNTVLISDAILGRVMVDREGRPCAAPGYYSPDLYIRSIENIEVLRPAQIFTAHFPPFVGVGAREFLSESKNFVAELELSILNVLKGGVTASTRDVVSSVGRALCLWPEDADMSAVYPVMGHLERLKREGRVQMKVHADRFPTWRLD